MIEINSKNNDIIKDLIKIREHSKYRKEKSLFYVEGERIIKDSPINIIDKLFVLKDKVEYYSDFISKIDKDKIYVLHDQVFDKIKDTVNSQGIIALINYNLVEKLNNELLKSINTCLILDNVSDPGNLGTIIRLAEASNISLIILANNYCDVYNTKVIRSCMSSIFRSNIYISNDIINDINTLKSHSYNIYTTVLDKSSKKYSEINYSKKCAIVFGNEANGVSEEIIKISNQNIYIPMCGQIESLNVSIAATTICYEIMRQNNYYEVKR